MLKYCLNRVRIVIQGKCVGAATPSCTAHFPWSRRKSTAPASFLARLKGAATKALTLHVFGHISVQARLCRAERDESSFLRLEPHDHSGFTSFQGFERPKERLSLEPSHSSNCIRRVGSLVPSAKPVRRQAVVPDIKASTCLKEALPCLACVQDQVAGPRRGLEAGRHEHPEPWHQPLAALIAGLLPIEGRGPRRYTPAG